MKYQLKFLLFLTLFFCQRILAQNLVPNGQFERADSSICPPPSFANISVDLTPWIEFGSADCLNLCDTSDYSGVPKNRFGFQYPYSGNGYAGFIAYYSTGFSREYIESPLANSLVSGVQYYVSFRLSLQDTMQYAIENIGALFTDTLFNPYPAVGVWVTGNPQIENTPGNMLDDKINWMMVSDSFVASGGEQFITIGNFKNDANTVKQFLGGTTINTLGANYYIDDVYVGTTPPLSINENNKEKDIIKLYPNPNDGSMTLECNLEDPETGELIIYSLTGKPLKSYPLSEGMKVIQIDASVLGSGLYLYEFKIDGQFSKNGKLSVIK
ncbi:MAG TPA: T9SS type A sorting domain-containing protein [Bacteroidia bacterium]|jgi:hypothetical protein